MNWYFNIPLEFQPEVVDAVIEKNIKENIPGYVCAVDCTNLSVAYENDFFMRVLSQSLVNKSDSSWIPVLINHLYGTNFSRYCGPDLFLNFIKKKSYKHMFLGSSQPILYGLRAELSKIDPEIESMEFVELPFLSVTEFDYKGIGDMINANAPDLIWVALGAPKQEQFMYFLKAYIKRGVMIGGGAVFNFYSGVKNVPKRAPKWMINLRLEFLYRIFSEPQKQIMRCLKILTILPKIYKEERMRCIQKEVKSIG